MCVFKDANIIINCQFSIYYFPKFEICKETVYQIGQTSQLFFCLKLIELALFSVIIKLNFTNFNCHY